MVITGRYRYFMSWNLHFAAFRHCQASISEYVRRIQENSQQFMAARRLTGALFHGVGRRELSRDQGNRAHSYAHGRFEPSAPWTYRFSRVFLFQSWSTSV